VTAARTTPLLRATDALSRRFVLAPEAPEAAAAPTRQRRRRVDIGGIAMLLPSDMLGEIVEAPRLHRVPNTRPSCRGLVNLRGNLAVLFDLEHELGLAPLRDARWALLLALPYGLAGFPIHTLPRSCVVDKAIDTAPPAGLPALLAEHVDAIHRDGDDLLLDVRFGGLLGALATRARAA
jgi:chemotaxis signal transduction protein